MLKTTHADITIKFKVKVTKNSSQSGIRIFDHSLILSNQRIRFNDTDYGGLSTGEFHEVNLIIIKISEDNFIATLVIDNKTIFSEEISNTVTEEFFSFWVSLETKKIRFKDLIIFDNPS